MDGSDSSSTALRWAIRQSEGRPVRLETVRADSPTVGNRLANTIMGRLRGLRRSLGGRTDPGAGTGTGSGTGTDTGSDRTGDDAVHGDGRAGAAHVTAHIVHGPPGRVLVEAASAASLLVVGRHGAGGGWRHTLGSVSRYCVTHASRPVVVVPPGWSDEPLRRIVVGFDGSATARAALDWALDFAGDDTDVRALIALEVAPWLQEDLVQIRLGEELDAERERLLGLLAAADPAGRATAVVEVRGAKAALARAAETTDLVVVGARGAGRVAGIGSVSTWLLEGSPCPVVVVPDASAT